MIDSIGSVITPAIAIAASPIPIVVTVLVLASPRGRSNGPAFALGWYLGASLLAGAVAFLAGSADVADEGTAADTGANVLQVLLGVLLLGLALRKWRGRPRPGTDAPTPAVFSRVADLGPLGAFATGGGLVLANLKNIPLAISSGVAIAQHDELTGGSAALAVAAFGLLATSSVLVLVVYALLAGERSHLPLEKLKGWLLAHNAALLVVLFTVLGIYLVSTGLTGAG